MPAFKKIKFDFDWKHVTTTKPDWAAQSPASLRSMLQQLYLIRTFETTLLELKDEGLVHGPVHSSVGQEAVAVGAMAALRPADGIAGTHRAHHQFLAKAYTFHTSEAYDPIQDAIPTKLQESVTRLLAEIMGLKTGCCGGRGGSMHLCDPAIGVLGTNAIVGGGIPLATGAAFAQKYLETGNVVVSFFGDGAINQGAFHEACNLAGLWNLPILYVLENNRYAVATTLAESAPVEQLSVRAAGYGMAGRMVDGMDPLAVAIAVQEAVESLRKGRPPVLIEVQTYRHFHHAGNVPGSAFGYRARQEEAQWKQRDPLENFPRKLLDMGVVDESQRRRIADEAQKLVSEAVTACVEKHQGKRIARPDLTPSPGSVTHGLRSNKDPDNAIQLLEPGQLVCDTEMTYVEAIVAVTDRWLAKDPHVFVLGEEVGHMRGGAYQATRGLAAKYPGRVLDTPISEAGFCGLAGGAAMSGLLPIVEIMFPDFALVAADQIFNQIGKLRHMYGGDNVDIPLVMRTRIAAGCGYGGQHSMEPAALFALFPGWRILAPTTAADYIGLFNSAMRCKDPVLIVEHHELYNTTGLVPSNNPDYCVPVDRARKLRDGSDVTVLTYSWGTVLTERAADQLAAEGIEVDLIDLRALSMPDVDYRAIGQSIEKTLNAVIVELSPSSNSIGARISHECQRRFFDYLDGPIHTLTGADVPAPVSRWTEAAAMLCVDDIASVIRRSAQRRL